VSSSRRACASRRRIPPREGGREGQAGVVADLPHELVGRHRLPAVVLAGEVRTAANVDPSWIGTQADTLFAECDSAAR